MEFVCFSFEGCGFEDGVWGTMGAPIPIMEHGCGWVLLHGL